MTGDAAFDDLEGFEVDLWEVIECDFCGADAGEPCRTIAGVSTTRSHKCRRVRVQQTPVNKQEKK